MVVDDLFGVIHTAVTHLDGVTVKKESSTESTAKSLLLIYIYIYTRDEKLDLQHI